MANTILRTSKDMRCLSQLSHNSVSSPYSQFFLRDLQPKNKLNIPCCKLKLFLKTHFDYRHLTSSSFLLLPYKPSEEVTKHKHVTTLSRSTITNNIPSRYQNKKIYHPKTTTKTKAKIDIYFHVPVQSWTYHSYPFG